ncbi:MAG TPA: HAD-IC family P-type ATPase, partial [Nannocystis sp.]
MSPRRDPNENAPAHADWHALDAGDVLERLGSRAEGLTADEAAQRLATWGPNELPQAAPPSPLRLFLRQFNSPLISVLAAAAAVSLVVGERSDAVFIAVVLLANAAIGAWQEWRAEQGSRSLRQLLQVRATVLRGGAVEIPAEDVVPGDVVLLESGMRVPADLRLLSHAGLEVDESFLTGESLAVAKDAGFRGDAGTPTGDRRNMAYAGAMVVRGRGRGVAVATGRRTEVGRLAEGMMRAGDAKPPLILRMERFSRLIARVMLLAAALVAVLGVLVQGRGAQEMFFFAIALAVAAIPEGLPAALTVTLSVASGRMARRGAMVRRLPAVEALGSCTVIASDKTGTLTCNELTVREVRLADGSAYAVTGEGYAPVGALSRDGAELVPGAPAPELLASLVRAGILNNEGDLRPRGDAPGEWTWRGDPTDIALLALARKVHGPGGEDGDPDRVRERYPQRASIPFEAENRYSATWHAGF